MPFNTKCFFAIGLVSCLVFGKLIYNSVLESQVEKQQEDLKLALLEAENLMQRSYFSRAAKLLDDYQEIAAGYPELHDHLKRLLATTALQAKDDQILYRLWQSDPKIIESKEPLSLKAAQAALANQKLDAYHSLAKNWKSEPENKETWILLEADAYALQGEPQKAMALLNSVQWDAEAEVARLTRLALLNLQEHPKISWDYLLKALQIDQNHPDLHLYRAQLLENQGLHELSALEYKNALIKGTQDPFYKEIFADFLIQKQQLQEASHFLQTALTPKASDQLWLKALFLSKIYQPSGSDLANETPPNGPATPFIRYLLATAPNEFWNDALLTSQAPVEQASNKILEANWLKVLEQLKLGYDAAALDTLQNHPEMAILNPPLYEGFKNAIVLHHPLLKEHYIPSKAARDNQTQPHPIFQIIAQAKTLNDLPKEYAALMTGQDAYAALALAAGWYEAALNLHQFHPYHLKRGLLAELPADYPRWVAFGFAKALLQNRSTDEALTFIKHQKPTPQLSLLAAEIHLKLQNTKEAENFLNPLARIRSPLGQKAAILLSNLYTSQNNFIQARQAIVDQPELSNSITGKETLARLENTFGDPALAERMYAALEDSSIEAQSFLAKKAYLAKDYKTAYKLTKKLLNKMPDSEDLKSQLYQITKAASLSP